MESRLQFKYLYSLYKCRSSTITHTRKLFDVWLQWCSMCCCCYRAMAMMMMYENVGAAVDFLQQIIAQTFANTKSN